MADLNYDCPNCARAVTVADSLIGQNLICPHCEQEFCATPPAEPSEPPRERLPFFKFSRRKILKDELEHLTADGEYSEADHKRLIETATRLGLKEDEIHRLRLKEIGEAFKPIKERIYQTAHVTDEDMAHFSELARRFQVTIEQEPALKMCREIYLMEVKGENPLVPCDPAGLMLDQRELLYFSTPSGWSQLRSKTTGYRGMSVSLPTGVRGVRLRLGQLAPIRSEELTVLAQGTLHVTSKRLLFNGDRCNTSVALSRIIGKSLFSDAVEIEKSTGRSDYFSMNALQVRYVSAVVECLKSAGA